MKACSENLLNNSGLLVVSALPVELRLLIDHYRAGRVEHAGSWPVYVNADKSVVLLESGVGGISSAAAIAHAMSHFKIPTSWSVLNIGIAGSGLYPVGQWVLAQSVLDMPSNTPYYLRPPRVQGIPRGTVRSYALPSSEYATPALLDMEAAAVVATAKRFVALEQIGVIKLVSDNSEGHQRALDKKSVLALMQKNFSTLITVLDYYRQYSQKQSNAMDLEPVPHVLLDRMHFSVSHKRQLERLWRSYRVFFPNGDGSDFEELSTAREVIAHMKDKLQRVSVHWEEECV